MMAEKKYRFYQLADELTEKYGFDAIPFPVSVETSKRIFRSESVSLDAVLDALDRFLGEYPQLKPKYATNAAKLAMLCATNNVFAGKMADALGNLNAGLRIYPEHRGMVVHQALALQMNGYDEAAAVEYERLLGKAPQAYDPVLRALAAKAFMSLGQYEKAFVILDFLPEKAFQDEALAKLRQSIADKLLPEPGAEQPTQNKPVKEPALVCPSCGEPVLKTHKFCPSCATPLHQREEHSLKAEPPQFCVHCGAKIKPGNSFCTQCGKAA